MLKFINKIIKKLRDWSEISTRKILESYVKSLCSRITNKYCDIRLKCYYDSYDPNTFMIYVSEIYANNIGFQKYINVERNYFKTLYPDILIVCDHFNPTDYECYYNPKHHKLIYNYE